jgi:DNA-binding NarL/FixJ family response regulator
VIGFGFLVEDEAMRSIRLVYVENDAALRSVLGAMFANSREIELFGSFGRASEVLEAQVAKNADVALIDFSLQQGGMTGVELGIALREMNPYIGVVIYSQFPVKSLVQLVPTQNRFGWSFIEKSGDMTIFDYLQILKTAAASKGNWQEVLSSNTEKIDQAVSPYFALTPRQRSVMALSAQGRTPQDIASSLGLSYSHVRKELSRAYAVLVPDADGTTDLRTTAVIRYLEIFNSV